MTGRNSAVSLASPPKPPSKPRRNAPHPTTRKQPRETRGPFAPNTQAFGVSGWHRCVRLRANARKYRDYSDDHGNRKYTVISGRCLAEQTGFEPRLTESESGTSTVELSHTRPPQKALKRKTLRCRSVLPRPSRLAGLGWSVSQRNPHRTSLESLLRAVSS